MIRLKINRCTHTTQWVLHRDNQNNVTFHYLTKILMILPNRISLQRHLAFKK